MNVIKLGGSLLDDPVRRAEALNAIAAQWKQGDEIVLVHGGGKHVDANLKRAGIAKRTYAGLRVTDDATLDVVVATLAGSVNKMLVAELAAIGVRCAGVSGCDASTLTAEIPTFARSGPASLGNSNTRTRADGPTSDDVNARENRIAK